MGFRDLVYDSVKNGERTRGDGMEFKHPSVARRTVALHRTGVKRGYRGNVVHMSSAPPIRCLTAHPVQVSG